MRGRRGHLCAQEGLNGMTSMLDRSRFSGSLVSPVSSRNNRMTYIRARRVATATFPGIIFTEDHP